MRSKSLVVAALLVCACAVRPAAAQQPPVVECVDQPALNPFQASAYVSFDAPVNPFFATIQVPAGKRLVIQHVTGSIATIGTGLQAVANYPALVSLQTVFNASTVEHFLTPIFLGSLGTTKQWTLSQATRLYAEGLISVSVVPKLATSGSATVTLAGYLVDIATRQ